MLRHLGRGTALTLAWALGCQGSVIDGAGEQTQASGGSAGGIDTPSAGNTGMSGAPLLLPPSNCEPTTASVHSEIVLRSCTAARCHGSDAPAATLDLSRADWSSKLVSVSAATCEDRILVVPGSPERSFFYQKLVLDAPGCEGERMPVGELLAASDLACVEAWIRTLEPSSCETCGGDTCVSLLTDANHCGGCGARCPAEATCQAGQCRCPGDRSVCGDACVDPAGDVTNCGGCGVRCPDGSSCEGGSCECSGALSACGAGCHDLGSDAEHCGDCSTACSEGQVCLDGACASGCGALSQCDLSCVDLATSAVHCGTCGTACAAGLACIAGACACPNGKTACGGACVDTTTDPRNCGGCGTACSPGAACTDGACRCSDTAVSFAADVQPIFSASCNAAGCHSGARPKEGLSLEPGKAYDALVEAPASQCADRLLVKPGEPEASYLVQKLLGTNLCGGSQMPKAGQGIPDLELTRLTTWICQGARAN